MKIYTVVESTDDDGAIGVDTFASKKNAIKLWTKLVKANIGSTNLDTENPDGRDLTEQEIQEELNYAIKNDYTWAGWNTKVELFVSNLNK